MSELTREEVLSMLTLAYESAVVVIARQRGGNPKHFLEAASMLLPEEFETMRAAFSRQVDSLK